MVRGAFSFGSDFVCSCNYALIALDAISMAILKWRSREPGVFVLQRPIGYAFIQTLNFRTSFIRLFLFIYKMFTGDMTRVSIVKVRVGEWDGKSIAFTQGRSCSFTDFLGVYAQQNQY